MKVRQKLLLLSTGIAVVAFVLSYGHNDHDAANPYNKNVRQERIVEKIAEYMEDEDATISEEEFMDVARMIFKESKEHNLDYRLVLAIIKVESNFRHDAVSPKGARGLLQVKPSHAKYIAHNLGIKWLGAKTLDEPEKNIRIGVHFFSKLMDDYDNVNMALHAYNIGPTRLRAILSENSKPNKTFSTHVLREYSKNLILLPDP
jgi:soluble lytic murein transglycosylase